MKSYTSFFHSPFQHVEKVQRKLGFCCLWWYNKDGDEDVRKESKK